MKIKVGDTIYSGEDQPIMVILNGGDRCNIENMPDEYTKYCACPDTMTAKEIREFMEIGDDNVRVFK